MAEKKNAEENKMKKQQLFRVKNNDKILSIFFLSQKRKRTNLCLFVFFVEKEVWKVLQQ
jgi:hypothetical protein